jgi:hypothetical protein
MDLYIHSSIRLHGVVLNYSSTGTSLPLYPQVEYIFVSRNHVLPTCASKQRQGYFRPVRLALLTH